LIAETISLLMKVGVIILVIRKTDFHSHTVVCSRVHVLLVFFGEIRIAYPFSFCVVFFVLFVFVLRFVPNIGCVF